MALSKRKDRPKEPGMAEDEKDVKNAQNSSASVELFDSTALFHWCRPRAYETVILVGITSLCIN